MGACFPPLCGETEEDVEKGEEHTAKRPAVCVLRKESNATEALVLG